MMKKLSKLALFAAATAFLLAACSHSSSGEGNNKDGEVEDDPLQDTYTGPATTDSWNFVGNTEVFSLITNGTNTSASDGVTYTIAEATDITGTDGNLKLTLLTASGTSINYAVQFAATDSASTKGLRFKGEALKISGVKGKVILAFDYTAAGDSSRTLTVKAGDKTWPKDTADKDTHNFETEINAGSGTDITISADNNYWIKALTISEQTATFTVSTNDSTANNLTTLGLIGETVASSNTTVATAIIADGKVKITSAQAGEATIIVKNSADKEATIAVTVKSSGEIEIGTIGKFTRNTPTVDITKKATSNEATDAEGTITWDGLTDLEWNTDGETWLTAADASLTVTAADSDGGKTATVTGLSARTYYVRAAASDDYEASESATLNVTAEGASLAWTKIGGGAVTFTGGKVTLNKKEGIYLPEQYTTGKKVVLSFTVNKDSVNADTSSKICGGFAQDDTFEENIFGVFASNKGVSNGSKPWNNGGSSNGYNNSVAIHSSAIAAVADVIFTVTYTIGQEATDGSDIVLNGTITDGTTTGTKDVKQKEVKWENVSTGGEKKQPTVVPYIYFGEGKTETITVSNITLTVDNTSVTTNAN